MVGGVDPCGVNGRGLLTPVSPECLAYPLWMLCGCPQVVHLVLAV